MCGRSLPREKNQSPRDFAETTAAWRRGTTLTLTLLHETYHDATVERYTEILPENQSRTLFNRVSSDRYFFFFENSPCRNDDKHHRTTLGLRRRSSCLSIRLSPARLFSLVTPAFFYCLFLSLSLCLSLSLLQYQTHPLRVSAEFIARHLAKHQKPVVGWVCVRRRSRDAGIA